MQKVLLVIPPDYDRNYPPLGTPALAAYLKKHAIPCEQLDLNLAYRDFLADHVTAPTPLTREERRFFLKPALERFFNEKLRGRYYSRFLPREAGLVERLPYGNNTNSSFSFGEQLLSSDCLWRYLEDNAENTFYQFYETSPIGSLLEKKGMSIVGISIISPAQAVAGLTLGLYIKKRFPVVHVTIGGPWATLYRHAIMQRPDLFRCFDSVIAFEGETALCELARCVDEKRPLSAVPNILVPGGATGDPALSRHEEDMDMLPCPDFDGLPLHEYAGNSDGVLALTYETSRGCYWSKCAYCVDLPLPRPSYRRKSPALAADGMRELKEKYGAGYLLFGDPGLSPRQMGELSRELITRDIRIDWWTMARLDPGFDRALFDLARRAGLRQINFGFESANDRVCRSLDKGNERKRSSRIIRDCAGAGIRVDLQTMLGLPGESFADGLDTVDFLVSHKEFIYDVTFNTYYLTPFNCVHRDPAKYGIEYEKGAPLPFQFFIPFKNRHGMDRDEAAALQKMYHSLARKDAPGGTHDRKNSSAGYVELSLNGEVCRLEYCRDPATEVYAFAVS